MFLYPRWHNFLMSSMSVLGIAANSVGVWRVASSFDLRRPVFALLMADSALSMTASWVFLAINGVFFEAVGISNAGLCYGFYLCLFLPGMAGIILTSLIAALRFFSIKVNIFSKKNLWTKQSPTQASLNNERFSERLQFLVIVIVVAIFLAYEITRLAAFNLMELGSPSVTFENCMRGPASTGLSSEAKVTLSIPIIGVPIASLVFDALIVKVIRERGEDCSQT